MMEGKVFFFLVCICRLFFAEGGYLLDGTTTPECWIKDLTSSANPQVYQTAGCPSTLNVQFLTVIPDTIIAGEEIIVQYKLTTSIPNLYFFKSASVGHANLHSCRTSLGACIPSIAASPGLVTQTPAVVGNLTSDGTTSSCIFKATLKLEGIKYY